jgi:hypothetical protein
VLVLNENRADLSASKLLTEFATSALFMAGPIDGTGLQAVADAAAAWVPALVERGARLVVPFHYGHFMSLWAKIEDELAGLGLVTQFGLTPGLVLPDHGVASDQSLLAWVDEVFWHGAMFNAHLFIGNSPRWVTVAQHLRKTKPGTTVTHWERKELDAAEHEKAWFWTGEE